MALFAGHQKRYGRVHIAFDSLTAVETSSSLHCRKLLSKITLIGFLRWMPNVHFFRLRLPSCCCMCVCVCVLSGGDFFSIFLLLFYFVCLNELCTSQRQHVVNRCTHKMMDFGFFSVLKNVAVVSRRKSTALFPRAKPQINCINVECPLIAFDNGFVYVGQNMQMKHWQLPNISIEQRNRMRDAMANFDKS